MKLLKDSTYDKLVKDSKDHESDLIAARLMILVQYDIKDALEEELKLTRSSHTKLESLFLLVDIA